MHSSIQTIRKIGKTYRHIERFRRILSIVIGNGFGYLFRDLRLLPVLGLSNKDINDSTALSSGNRNFAERFRTTLVELGPTYVKLGQILSCRPDILPADLVTELAKLRDHVKPFSFDLVRSIIRDELHGEIKDFFSSFDETPVGAASIAQGHHAVLKDGTEVFVKVQRPGIRNDIIADLEILKYLATQLEKNNEDLAFLKPTKIIEDFADGLERELDFNNERTSMLSFAKQFAGNDGIRIPKPFSNLCSTKVLTMEFIRGYKADDPDALRSAGIDPKAVAELGANLILEQFFEYGFFHGDPHAGNMFILPGPQVCYIDFGDMGRLTEEEKRLFGRLMTNIIMGDNKAATKIIMSMTTLDVKPDPEELERSVATLIDCHLKGDLQSLNMVQAAQDFYALCYKHKMCLKPYVYKMIKALGYADSMGRKLAPDFAIFKQIRPFVLKQAVKRLDVMDNLKELAVVWHDWTRVIKWMPEQIYPLVDRLISGKCSFKHSIDNLDELANSIKIIGNLLSASMIVMGMLVSSALLVHAHIPPLVHDVSLLGIIGFVGAFVIGCIILIGMVFSERK